jgi:nucleoside-diphosphate-sugar epimerase
VYPVSAFYLDVRDAAKAHVLALSSPPSSIVGRKRLVIASPQEVDFDKVVNLIRTKRPELEDRLVKTPAPQYAMNKLPFNKRIEEVLGMKESDFTPLESTVLDGVDGALAFEKQWIDAGFKIDIPLTG